MKNTPFCGIWTVTLPAGTKVQVSESTPAERIRKNVPLFFSPSSRAGERETYTFHRSFIIVRCTVQFTGRRPERKTILYLYTDDMGGTGPSVYLVCYPDGIRAAKKVADRVLELGEVKKAVNEYVSGLTS